MKKIYFIAEAGVNHNGDIGIAKELIKHAKDAGADIVGGDEFIDKIKKGDPNSGSVDDPDKIISIRSK